MHWNMSHGHMDVRFGDHSWSMWLFRRLRDTRNNRLRDTRTTAPGPGSGYHVTKDNLRLTAWPAPLVDSFSRPSMDPCRLRHIQTSKFKGIRISSTPTLFLHDLHSTTNFLLCKNGNSSCCKLSTHHTDHTHYYYCYLPGTNPPHWIRTLHWLAITRHAHAPTTWTKKMNIRVHDLKDKYM